MKKIVIISLVCISSYALHSAQPNQTIFQKFKSGVRSLGTKITTGANNLRKKAKTNLRLSDENEDEQSFMSVLKNNIKDSASKTPGVIVKGIKKAPGAIVDGGKSAGKYIAKKAGELKGYVGGKISRKKNIKALAQEEVQDNGLEENDDVKLTQQDQNDGESARNGNARRPSSASFTGQRNSSAISVRRQSMQASINEQSEPEDQVQEKDDNDDDNNLDEVSVENGKTRRPFSASFTGQRNSSAILVRRQSMQMPANEHEEQKNQVQKEDGDDGESGEEEVVEEVVPDAKNNYLTKITKKGNKTIEEYDSDKSTLGIIKKTHTTNKDGLLKIEAEHNSVKNSTGIIKQTYTTNKDGFSKTEIEYDSDQSALGKKTETYTKNNDSFKTVTEYDSNSDKNSLGIKTETMSYDKNRLSKVEIEYDPTKNKGIAKYESKDGQEKYFDVNNQEVDKNGTLDYMVK